jgi:small conductance mechanosensitive channel
MLNAIVLAQEAGETSNSCTDLGPLCNVLADWTGNEQAAQTVSWVLGTPVKIAIITVLALVLNRFARRLIRKVMLRVAEVTADSHVVSEHTQERADERSETIGTLLRSFSSAIILSAAAIMILAQLGIEVLPVIAGAGVLSLAIGFGAQSIVEDLLRGVFMLAEDQFGVGDRIDVGDVNGYVERVTLRTTVIRDPNGVLWHVPNSEINYVANEYQDSNRAVVEISIPYGSDMRRGMELLQEAAQRACDDREWRDFVRKPPEVRGIQEFDAQDILVRVQVWVEAGKMRSFQRHLRLYLQEGLDRAGLGGGNPSFDVFLKGGSGTREPAAV